MLEAAQQSRKDKAKSLAGPIINNNLNAKQGYDIVISGFDLQEPGQNDCGSAYCNVSANANGPNQGANDLPMVIVSDFDSSGIRSIDSGSAWHAVSDESFLREERTCDQLTASLSPVCINDSGNETEAQQTRSTLRSLISFSMPNLSPVSGTSAIRPLCRDLSLISGVNRLSRAEETEEMFDDEENAIEDELNDTINAVDKLIKEGQRLVKANVLQFNGRLTLSPTRIKALQEMGRSAE